MGVEVLGNANGVPKDCRVGVVFGINIDPSEELDEWAPHQE